jgi:hypothetical protein
MDCHMPEIDGCEETPLIGQSEQSSSQRSCWASPVYVIAISAIAASRGAGSINSLDQSKG